MMTVEETAAAVRALLAVSGEVLERVAAAGLESTDVPRNWLSMAERAAAGGSWAFRSEHAQLVHLDRRPHVMTTPLYRLVEALREFTWLRRQRSRREVDCALTYLAGAMKCLGWEGNAAHSWARLRYEALGGPVEPR